MKLFLLKTSLLLLITIALFLLIVSQADGYIDPFYRKFTSPQQENLMLGTSRCAQGLQPAIVSGLLHRSFLNYAFTIDHSPFGPAYFNSICRKLKKSSKDGTFIIAVDPWAISRDADKPDDPKACPENELCVGTTSTVDKNPNFEYLLENMQGEYYKLFVKDKTMFLHDDGWLEVNVSMDDAQVARRLKEKVDFYQNTMLPTRTPSTLRFTYLQKTIDLLKQHGRVYLVRLPIHPRMLEIENKMMPAFNQIIVNKLSNVDGYWDMTPNGALYQYTDGNHLYSTSSKVVSMKIATWIQSLQGK